MPRFLFRKKNLWRLHSWMGLIAGLGLLVIGLTGSVLVFSDEINRLLHPELATTSVEEPGERQPFDELLAAAEAIPGHRVTGWGIAADDPRATDRVRLVEEREKGAAAGDGGGEGEEPRMFLVQIDPYTGEVLSEPATSREYFVGWILELHYSLFAGHLGLGIAGGFALLLVLLGITGVWLYRDFWKNFFRLRWGRSARIFFSDLHKMVGISSVAFNLILGVTGAWWNLSHLVGHLLEEPAGTENAEEVVAEEKTSPSGLPPVSAMLAQTDGIIEGYVTRYIAFPNEPDSPVNFYGGHEDAGVLRGPYGSTIAFDPVTGEEIEHSDIREAPVSRQVLDSFVPLHFGTFGGWPVKVLWCLGGLAPGILAVSGFVLWLKRRGSGTAGKDASNRMDTKRAAERGRDLVDVAGITGER